MKQLSYAKTSRLTSAAEYKAVFSNPLKSQTSLFTVLVSPNQKGCARLGVIAGKKYLKKAVDRNRMKRIIRESFRQHQGELPAIDIVVLVRGNPTTLKDRKKCFQQLVHHWQEVVRLCRKQSIS